MSTIVLRHKLAVALFWLMALVAGIFASGGLGSRLSQQVALPGMAGYQVNQEIHRVYGNGGAGYPEIVSVTLPNGVPATGTEGRIALARGFSAISAIHNLRVADYANTGSRAFLTSDPKLSWGLVFTPYAGENVPDLAPKLTAAMRPELPHGSQVQVTGVNDLSGGGQGSQGQGVFAETLIAAVAALAVLAFLFGSALAFAPLVMALVSIPATFLAVYALTEVTSIFFIVQYLVALIGLGVAIDYSLLFVTRWREELASGCADSADAVIRAMARAGRSIVFSGLTVALGLLVLIVVPVPLVESIGIGSMLIPLVSVAVSITLLPVVLATIGTRIDRPRRPRSDRPSRAWSAWGRSVSRHPVLAATIALGILGALTAVATDINVGEVSAASLAAPTSPAAKALQRLEDAGAPSGALQPIEVLAPASLGRGRIASRLATLPGVRAAFAPTGAAWYRPGTELLTVLPVAGPSAAVGRDTIASVREAAGQMGAKVGGSGPLVLDENHAFYDEVPLLIGLLALVALVLLARAFGSVLLPLKAVLLNLVSTGASYGVIVLIWQDGHGSEALWALPATRAITNWVPLVAFAFLYGLSMDYEVFIVTRIREEYDRTGSNTQGVVEGLARTGRLVTGAALCLFFALAALTTTPQTDVRVLATALAAGILLDATVVRGLLLPSLVCLLGRWNWWVPAWATSFLSPKKRDRSS